MSDRDPIGDGMAQDAEPVVVLMVDDDDEDKDD